MNEMPVHQAVVNPHITTTEAIRLELGSGYNPLPGYTHLDLNPNAPDVDIIGPAFPLALPDESCAEIVAIDVLEHISYWDTDAALAEWARVLRPGGVLRLQVPDAHEIMHWYGDEPMVLLRGLPGELPQTPLAGAAWRLLGGHSDGVYAKDGDDWRLNAHYSLWSHESLVLALRHAGLEVRTMTTNPFPNIQCTAVKP